MELLISNVATGRDNVSGRILRLFPEATKVLLYSAEVERLAGREDSHVKDWAKFDVCLGPKKGDISYLSRWRPIFPSLHAVQIVRIVHVESSGRSCFTAPAAESRSKWRKSACESLCTRNSSQLLGLGRRNPLHGSHERKQSRESRLEELNQIALLAK